MKIIVEIRLLGKTKCVALDDCGVTTIKEILSWVYNLAWYGFIDGYNVTWEKEDEK